MLAGQDSLMPPFFGNKEKYNFVFQDRAGGLCFEGKLFGFGCRGRAEGQDPARQQGLIVCSRAEAGRAEWREQAVISGPQGS